MVTLHTANSIYPVCDSFILDSGDVVSCGCSYTPRDANVQFGYIGVDGLFYGLSGYKGSIDKGIRVNQRGSYTLAIVNDSDANVNTHAFAFCMGYGATDAGDILLTETGFDNQIDNAARLLLNNWNTAYQKERDNMPYYFEANDGGIYLDNCGTYALYVYTPWKSSNLLLAQVFHMMFPGSGQNNVDWS